MADQRKGGIAWTDETWNPIRGCSKISAGCTHCYAERQAARFCGPGQPYEGLIEKGRWNGQVRLVPEHLDDPLRWRRPRLVFVNAMSDLFHESLTDEQIDHIFGVMAAAPHHTFQVLTKRSSRMRQYLSQDRRVQWARAGAHGDDKLFDQIAHGPTVLPNVWVGVSAEDQKSADERLRDLVLTHAAVRWVSLEPLLGPVDISNWLLRRTALDEDNTGLTHEVPSGLVHWVVIGGESGDKARPIDLECVRNLRDQCIAGEVRVMLKQWGEWCPGHSQLGSPMHLQNGSTFEIEDNVLYDLVEGKTIGKVHCFRATDDEGAFYGAVRVGKKAAGRLLDGQLLDQYPAQRLEQAS